MFAESSIYNKKHKMTQSEIDIARSWRVTVEQLYISIKLMYLMKLMNEYKHPMLEYIVNIARIANAVQVTVWL